MRIGMNPFSDPTGSNTYSATGVQSGNPHYSTGAAGPTLPDPDTALRQSFMPEEFMAPFYNAQGVNANLGTMFAQLMPQTMGFLGAQMSPNLNAMEHNFLNTSAQDAAELMQRMMVQQEGQFHNTPFHSALPQAQAEVFDQFNRNLLNTGSQLALQRQQSAGQLAQIPIAGLQQSIDYGPQVSERMFNMLNSAYNARFQTPLQVYSQLPFSAPTLVQTGGGGGGGGFGKG